ncbi:hypothetical protein HNQ59_001379 [Chitinivorax tropicus]|uniref:Uncharacterized protein n=1 Tax=Chitinivorax tropicus TaxID=714531 RepID=A0A840MFR6_9PROT|nr:hypothetical protein [Chitinivorax tropicus]MBB5018094.1 hypothetical protein [Chitinivorax tropicus]
MYAILDTLQTWPDESLLRLIDHLKWHGWVTDEDRLGLSSTMIEHWDAACTGYLRAVGYAGADLGRVGYFQPGWGAIYALYDSVQFDAMSAREHLILLGQRLAESL